MFEEAIKHAQTYDDDHEKNGHESYAKSKWKGRSPVCIKFGRKRQSSSSPKGAKKPKTSHEMRHEDHLLQCILREKGSRRFVLYTYQINMLRSIVLVCILRKQILPGVKRKPCTQCNG